MECWVLTPMRVAVHMVDSVVSVVARYEIEHWPHKVARIVHVHLWPSVRSKSYLFTAVMLKHVHGDDHVNSHYIGQKPAHESLEPVCPDEIEGETMTQNGLTHKAEESWRQFFRLARYVFILQLHDPRVDCGKEKQQVEYVPLVSHLTGMQVICLMLRKDVVVLVVRWTVSLDWKTEDRCEGKSPQGLHKRISKNITVHGIVDRCRNREA